MLNMSGVWPILARQAHSSASCCAQLLQTRWRQVGQRASWPRLLVQHTMHTLPEAGPRMIAESAGGNNDEDYSS